MVEMEELRLLVLWLLLEEKVEAVLLLRVAMVEALPEVLVVGVADQPILEQ
jgi:hypothetical protein